jgi:hypothetical protein
VVLVTNLELGARRWFATPKKGPATAAVRELVGKDSLERAAAWPALEKAKGFRGAAEVALGGGSQGEPVALGGSRRWRRWRRRRRRTTSPSARWGYGC